MNDDAMELIHRATKASFLRLFLDYDGTLADFSPSPDILLPDPNLIALVKRLVSAKGILPAILSGRKLEHIEKLLPIKGLLLAGTYGIEMKLPDGQYRSALEYQEIRPIIERIFPLWKKIIKNRDDFYLEDKGWSIALHGRFARETDAHNVMESAHQIVKDHQPDPLFGLFEGERFLEYAPLAASKTIATKWIVDHLTPKDAFPVYIGDDDKDEEAFAVAIKSGGLAIRISDNSRITQAQFCLNNPTETRIWLNELLSLRRE